MAVTVIIPALNAAATLEYQLRAIRQQDQKVEVLVADNGSTDATCAIAQAHGARVVDASAQRGQAYARNVAAANTDASVLAFCDADDVVGNGWLAIAEQAWRAGTEFLTGPVAHFSSPTPPASV